MGELVGTNKLKPSPGSYHLSGSEAALVAEGNSLLVPEHLEGHSEAQGLGVWSCALGRAEEKDGNMFWLVTSHSGQEGKSYLPLSPQSVFQELPTSQ